MTASRRGLSATSRSGSGAAVAGAEDGEGFGVAVGLTDARASRSVTGPSPPDPTGIPSIAVSGTTSQAVPRKKASSAR